MFVLVCYNKEGTKNRWDYDIYIRINIYIIIKLLRYTVRTAHAAKHAHAPTRRKGQ